jgi:hypothetical protein
MRSCDGLLVVVVPISEVVWICALGDLNGGDCRVMQSHMHFLIIFERKPNYYILIHTRQSYMSRFKIHGIYVIYGQTTVVFPIFPEWKNYIRTTNYIALQKTSNKDNDYISTSHRKLVYLDCWFRKNTIQNAFQYFYLGLIIDLH